MRVFDDDGEPGSCGGAVPICRLVEAIYQGELLPRDRGAAHDDALEDPLQFLEGARRARRSQRARCHVSTAHIIAQRPSPFSAQRCTR